jgi:hypothetical protein
MSGPRWFKVPAGARSGTCSGLHCSATIYWILHPRTGRPHPIQCDLPGGARPSTCPEGAVQGSLFGSAEAGEEPRGGRGISHFEDCPDAARFRPPPVEGPAADVAGGE